MMARARRAISITVPTMTLLLGGGAAKLFWQPKTDEDLAALVRICTQQAEADHQQLTELQRQLRRNDSTLTVWAVALCQWVPANVRHNTVQC